MECAHIRMLPPKPSVRGWWNWAIQVAVANIALTSGKPECYYVGVLTVG